MARHIVDNHLGRISIGELRVVALLEIDLRMIGRCHDTDLDGLLQSRFAGCEATVGSIGVMTLDGVADVIGEDRYAVHLADILFERPAFRLQGRVMRLSTPRHIRTPKDLFS